MLERQREDRERKLILFSCARSCACISHVRVLVLVLVLKCVCVEWRDWLQSRVLERQREDRESKLIPFACASYCFCMSPACACVGSYFLVLVL